MTSTLSIYLTVLMWLSIMIIQFSDKISNETASIVLILGLGFSAIVWNEKGITIRTQVLIEQLLEKKMLHEKTEWNDKR